jgi:hypothetical protein
VTERLQEAGYTVVGIRPGFDGPILEPEPAKIADKTQWNFVATLEADRVPEALRRPGWDLLKRP